MKSYIKILSFIFFLFALACNKNGVTIKGKLENTGKTYIYLQELNVDNGGKIDSILPSSRGTFKFSENIKYPTFYTLKVGDDRPIILLAMPYDRISITGRADSLFHTYELAGSEESERVRELNLQLDKTTHQLDSLQNVYKMFLDNPNIVQIKATLTMNFNRLVDEQRKYTISFIEKNPKSFANIMAVFQKIDNSTWVLYSDSDFKYFAKVDSAMFRLYRDAPYAQLLHSKVDEMRKSIEQAKVRKLLANMGGPAPEIALPTPRGDTVRLSSTKGKVVLLDFWASWCEPCREKNPELVALYNKYKSEGFTIFQVSLDKTKEQWVEAIRKDNLTWTNVSDLGYWNSPVVNTYSIDEIPTSFLIDKDGSIVGRNLSDEDLEIRIEKLLSAK